MPNQVWLLVEHYNEYDQHGGYTIAVYTKEPNKDDLKSHAYSYFGRKKNEYVWVEKELWDVN